MFPTDVEDALTKRNKALRTLQEAESMGVSSEMTNLEKVLYGDGSRTGIVGLLSVFFNMGAYWLYPNSFTNPWYNFEPLERFETALKWSCTSSPLTAPANLFSDFHTVGGQVVDYVNQNSVWLTTPPYFTLMNYYAFTLLGYVGDDGTLGAVIGRSATWTAPTSDGVGPYDTELDAESDMYGVVGSGVGIRGARTANISPGVHLGTIDTTHYYFGDQSADTPLAYPTALKTALLTILSNIITVADTYTNLTTTYKNSYAQILDGILNANGIAIPPMVEFPGYENPSTYLSGFIATINDFKTYFNNAVGTEVDFDSQLTALASYLFENGNIPDVINQTNAIFAVITFNASLFFSPFGSITDTSSTLGKLFRSVKKLAVLPNGLYAEANAVSGFTYSPLGMIYPDIGQGMYGDAIRNLDEVEDALTEYLPNGPDYEPWLATPSIITAYDDTIYDVDKKTPLRKETVVIWKPSYGVNKYRILSRPVTNARTFTWINDDWGLSDSDMWVANADTDSGFLQSNQRTVLTASLPARVYRVMCYDADETVGPESFIPRASVHFDDFGTPRPNLGQNSYSAQSDIISFAFAFTNAGYQAVTTTAGVDTIYRVVCVIDPALLKQLKVGSIMLVNKETIPEVVQVISIVPNSPNTIDNKVLLSTNSAISSLYLLYGYKPASTPV